MHAKELRALKVLGLDLDLDTLASMDVATLEQLMALVGAADPTNPALVLIVAYVAKNVQNGNRAAQEYLLDWGELSEHTDASGRTVGFSTEVALTKVDRKQVGERKPLQCPSTCQGRVVIEEGIAER